MELFQDVKTCQRLVQLEDQLKIVKLQNSISQHVYGIEAHLHVLRNHVPLLVFQQQQDFWNLLLLRIVLAI